MIIIITIILSIAIFISVIFLLFRFSGRFKNYTVKKWPDITVSTLLVLLGSSIAVTGIYWTIQNESNSFYYNQLDVLKRSFPAVTEETAGNQALIKKLKKRISHKSFNVRRV